MVIGVFVVTHLFDLYWTGVHPREMTKIYNKTDQISYLKTAVLPDKIRFH